MSLVQDIAISVRSNSTYRVLVNIKLILIRITYSKSASQQ
jgi:hypothetical protein